MDVIVYQTKSSHNILTRMGASLTKALQNQGVDATFYSPRPGDTELSVIDTLAAAGVRAAIAFNSVTTEWHQDGVSIYDRLGCAFVGWDADHPSYNRARFILPMARRGQVCASASHVAFAQALGCKATSRLMLPGADPVEAAPLPIAERRIHGLVAMQWMGEPEVWWADMKGTPAYALIEGTVARVLADPGADLFAAFQATAGELGLQPAFDTAHCAMVAGIGRFVRQYDRLRLARSLAEADVPCAICGDGWRERLGERPNLLYADDLDVEGLAKLYGHARVVFNVNGSNGASERAIQAMAAGAMVASDYSPFLESSFGPDQAMAFYDRRDMGGVHEALGLGVEVQQAVADRGRHAVATRHLWSHKAEALIEMLRAEPFGIELVR